MEIEDSVLSRNRRPRSERTWSSRSALTPGTRNLIDKWSPKCPAPASGSNSIGPLMLQHCRYVPRAPLRTFIWEVSRVSPGQSLGRTKPPSNSPKLHSLSLSQFKYPERSRLDRLATPRSFSAVSTKPKPKLMRSKHQLGGHSLWTRHPRW